MKKLFFLFVAVLCCTLTIQATEGALPGAFTINANGDKIQFSRGNLEFNARMLRLMEQRKEHGVSLKINGRLLAKKTIIKPAVLLMDGLTISYGEQADTTTSIRI